MTGLRASLLLGAVACGLLCGVFPSSAHAQDPPCTDEIRTLCAEVQPGGGRILQCLKTNETKLYMACTQRVQSLQEAVSGSLGACRDGWVAYCYHPRATTERGAMVQCLQTHQAQLSSACQKALQGAGGKQQQRSRGSSGTTP